MLRKLACSCAVLLFCVGLVVAQGAGDVEATVKMVDPDRRTALITVMQDGGIRNLQWLMRFRAANYFEKGWTNHWLDNLACTAA